MSLKAINIGKRKFDTNEKPWVIPWYLNLPMGAVILAYDLRFHLKIRKHNFEGTKPPYFVLQNHSSFIDFLLTYKTFYPRRYGWITAIDQFVHREWIMRELGCMYKRKFTADVKVVQHIFKYLRDYKKTVVIFPEARFSFMGINEEADLHTYARLIKMAKVPVVLGMSKGNFIHSPQWDLKPYKKIPISADFTVILKKEEVEKLSVDEIEKILTEKFVYDDFKYWQESGVKIKSNNRAQNLHKVLYKCPHCGKEFEMDSNGNELWCNACGHKWIMTENGFLKALNGETYFPHAPDWYRWEREEVKKEVYAGKYKTECPAKIEWLKCTHDGFVPFGNGTFTHDENGLTFTGKKLDDNSEFNLNRPVPSLYSCHVEFDYFGRGDAVDISTYEDTYYVYPSLKNRITKIHLAEEEMFRKWKKEEQEKKEQENKEGV